MKHKSFNFANIFEGEFDNAQKIVWLVEANESESLALSGILVARNVDVSDVAVSAKWLNLN